MNGIATTLYMKTHPVSICACGVMLLKFYCIVVAIQVTTPSFTTAPIGNPADCVVVSLLRNIQLIVGAFHSKIDSIIVAVNIYGYRGVCTRTNLLNEHAVASICKTTQTDR
jgi:hypothetical protein